MQIQIGNSWIELVQGDITRQDTEAIVNAANRSLLGGGGVDGAIHRAGGPTILQECRKLGGCETGGAKRTGGGNLKAQHVIHAVGPIWRGGGVNEEALLRSAYRNSLHRALEAKARSVAFPSISTGAYRYPVARAARAALGEVMDFLPLNPEIELVRFVLFDGGTFSVYEQTLAELAEARRESE